MHPVCVTAYLAVRLVCACARACVRMCVSVGVSGAYKMNDKLKRDHDPKIDTSR